MTQCKKNISILKTLEKWLEDNVEQNSELAFSNDGAIRSDQVLCALREVLTDKKDRDLKLSDLGIVKDNDYCFIELKDQSFLELWFGNKTLHVDHRDKKGAESNGCLPIDFD